MTLPLYTHKLNCCSALRQPTSGSYQIEKEMWETLSDKNNICHNNLLLLDHLLSTSPRVVQSLALSCRIHRAARQMISQSGVTIRKTMYNFKCVVSANQAVRYSTLHLINTLHSTRTVWLFAHLYVNANVK